MECLCGLVCVSVYVRVWLYLRGGRGADRMPSPIQTRSASQRLAQVRTLELTSNPHAWVVIPCSELVAQDKKNSGGCRVPSHPLDYLPGGEVVQGGRW